MSITPDLSKLMQQAQQMQDNIKKAQQDLANMMVEGVSGAGLVKVDMNGKHEVSKIQIDDSLLTEQKEILEDLVAAAVNDAVRKIEDNSKGKMSGLMSGVKLPEGFNIPGM